MPLIISAHKDKLGRYYGSIAIKLNQTIVTIMHTHVPRSTRQEAVEDAKNIGGSNA